MLLIQSCSSKINQKKELNLVCEGKETTKHAHFGSETVNTVFYLKLAEKLKTLKVNKFLYLEGIEIEKFNAKEKVWVAQLDNGMPIFREDSIGLVDGPITQSQTIKNNSVVVDANQVLVLSRVQILYAKADKDLAEANFFRSLTLQVNRQTGVYNMTTHEMYGKEYFLITSEGSCRLAKAKF